MVKKGGLGCDVLYYSTPHPNLDIGELELDKLKDAINK